MDVIIDTNMLMAIIQFKIDLFNELRFMGVKKMYIPKDVINELKTIRNSKPIVEIVERMIKRGELIEIGEGPVDVAIVKEAEKLGAVIATNDKKIIKNAKKRGIKVIRLRQKKFLVME